MEKNSKIYIAGHRGLLGNALTKLFTQQGYTNTVARTRQELDCMDAAAVAEFFKKEKPEYVVIAAGRVGGIGANSAYPAEFIHENITIQNNIIHNAYRVGVKKLIFFGSSCMYPKMASQPMKEEDILTGEIEPTSKAYGIAKIAGMVMCQSYNKQYGTKFITLIPNTLYGPHDDFDQKTSHVFSALLRKFHEAKIRGEHAITLWGTGTPKREFLYVDDCAEACLHVLRNETKYEVMNVGTGVDVAIKDLAGIIKRVTGFEGEIIWDTTKPDGAPRKLLEKSKIESMGWRAKTPLEEGVANTYNWFKEYGENPLTSEKTL